MNANIAEYHVPVNADVHDIKVIFVDEPDEIINPLGIKGLGEIGIVGVAAAIANAVYHATESACAIFRSHWTSFGVFSELPGARCTHRRQSSGAKNVRIL